MRTKMIFLLLVCMALSAGAISNFNEADNPPQQNVQYRGWLPWYRRPYFPIPRYNPPVLSPPSPVDDSPPPPSAVLDSPPPPPPVEHSPPTFSPPPVETKPLPSSPAPQQPSGGFNDPVKCETALVTIDNCVGDLITYFFGNSTSSIGQSCCNRMKQLSQPCFGRAFMDEPSYYDKVIKLCS